MSSDTKKDSHKFDASTVVAVNDSSSVDKGLVSSEEIEETNKDEKTCKQESKLKEHTNNENICLEENVSDRANGIPPNSRNATSGVPQDLNEDLHEPENFVISSPKLSSENKFTADKTRSDTNNKQDSNELQEQQYVSTAKTDGKKY